MALMMTHAMGVTRVPCVSLSKKKNTATHRQVCFASENKSRI
jgi:hypothetical protein